MKPEEVSFGIKPPHDVPVYWGARAIYIYGKLDIVYDRRTVAGPVPPEMSRAVKYALREIEKLQLHSGGNEVMTFSREGYVVKASCRGSYGYMYLGCWPEPSEGVSDAGE